MFNKHAGTVNRILLGLVMLVAGLIKLFVFKSAGVSGMLSGLGFPAATFFAWILILSEIVFGAAILLKWRLRYTVWPPIVILIVAAFTAYWPNDWMKVGSFLIHLALASNYWLLGVHSKDK